MHFVAMLLTYFFYLLTLSFYSQNSVTISSLTENRFFLVRILVHLNFGFVYHWSNLKAFVSCWFSFLIRGNYIACCSVMNTNNFSTHSYEVLVLPLVEVIYHIRGIKKLIRQTKIFQSTYTIFLSAYNCFPIEIPKFIFLSNWPIQIVQCYEKYIVLS